MHAHVRAESIIALSLHCMFNMFAELEAYFATHFINKVGQEVGHPSGNLQFVGYLHYYGLHRGAPEANLTRMAAICNNLDPYYDEYLSSFGVRGMYSPAELYNWSNIDLNLRYRRVGCEI